VTGRVEFQSIFSALLILFKETARLCENCMSWGEWCSDFNCVEYSRRFQISGIDETEMADG